MSTVKDILKNKGTSVCTVEKKASVADAARLMNARGIGALVVMEEEKVVGVFSERDILTRVVVAQKDPATTLVEEVMTTRVACCDSSTSLKECRAILFAKDIRHLPIIDADELVGIITVGDLMACEVHEQEETIQNLQHYIDGSYA